MPDLLTIRSTSMENELPPTDPANSSADPKRPDRVAGTPIRSFGRVVSNQLDGNGRKLLLEVEQWPGSEPGQFLMIGAGAVTSVPRHDPLLPRPMAIYRDHSREIDSSRATGDLSGSPDEAGARRVDDPSDARIEVLYRVVGRGTTLLSEAEPGDRVSLVGPLGQGFPVEADSRPALLVGGGTGIASLFELAGALHAAGREVVVLLGARGEADLIGRSDFEALPIELVCATEDGSYGEQGRVTAPLEKRLSALGGEATVFACGPTPMMHAAAQIAKTAGARCYVSLENPMACGFGVCLGCAAPRAEGGFSLVCKHGPVFEASEIDWAGLP